MSNRFSSVIDQLHDVLSDFTMEERINGLLQHLSYAVASANTEGLLEDVQFKLELIYKEMLEEIQEKKPAAEPFQPVKD